jgi:hypothetical protein
MDVTLLLLFQQRMYGHVADPGRPSASARPDGADLCCMGMCSTVCGTIVGMVTTRMTQVERRASLPLSPRDVADLARLRDLPIREELDLPEGEISEAVLLHAIFTAGLQAIEAMIQERAYAELADQYRKTAEGAERRAARRAPARFAEQ